VALETSGEPQQGAPVPNIDSVISAAHLTKQFGDDFAVRDISFEVPKACIFGFIGPSGSGKTTTVRMLTGVYTPTEGEVRVLGQNPVVANSKQRARIGYMPQLFVLYPSLTVWENLSFAASLYGMAFFRGKHMRETLEFVELYAHRNKLARNISGGMLRRLSLAATLLHAPDLLFLDEPTAGIDPILRQKFWDHFKTLQSQGRTIFFTTQYVSEANNCDLVGVMAEGKLLLVDTPTGMRQRAYGGDIVNFQAAAPLDYQTEQALRTLPFVLAKSVRTGPNSMRLIVTQASTAIPDLIEWARLQNLQIETMEQYIPPFEDVFVEIVRPEVKHG
jgi:ABC-2 type transport system ATP-binding protein